MKKQLMKRAALVMAASMAAVSLMGCGSGAGDKKTDTTAAESSTAAAGANDSTAAGTTEASKEPVTLRFSWWGSDSRHQALLAVIEAYEKKNPNVSVEAEYQGYDGYYEKIMTTLSSNTAPDIIHMSILTSQNSTE